MPRKSNLARSAPVSRHADWPLRYELKMLFYGSEFHSADPFDTLGAIHRSKPHLHIGGACARTIGLARTRTGAYAHAKQV